MSAAKRVRWECPHGLHPGELGSTRPRKNATVRFCWACSQEAGVLVERVAPALVRQRAARTASVEERRRTKVERARAAASRRYVVQVIDEGCRTVEVDVKAYLADCCRQLRVPMPELSLSSRRWPNTTGRAWPDMWPNGKVTITAGETWESLVEVILHEACHLAVGGRKHGRSSKKQWHGRVFKRRLFKAACARWPEIVPVLADDPRVERAITGRAAYDIDTLIVDALKTTTREG